MHELMHAVGFFDEHKRKDWDEFITVHYDNIATQKYKYCNNQNLGNVTTYV